MKRLVIVLLLFIVLQVSLGQPFNNPSTGSGTEFKDHQYNQDFNSWLENYAFDAEDETSREELLEIWNEKSTENWANLMKSSETHPIKDEGTLFKEISMTIDLLKQISEICDEGLLVSDNIIEEKYYRNLKETAEESIKLLSKQPVI